jgi:hypothetical protein
MCVSSVADPGCLSRIPDLGSRIPDPKTGTKERDEKKIWCHTFFCSHKFNKIVNTGSGTLVFSVNKFGAVN